MVMFSLLIFIALLVGCTPDEDGCAPKSTRCNGQVVELCDGEKRWTLLINCNELTSQIGDGGAWACKPLERPTEFGGHTCLPAGDGGAP